MNKLGLNKFIRKEIGGKIAGPKKGDRIIFLDQNKQRQ